MSAFEIDDPDFWSVDEEIETSLALNNNVSLQFDALWC